MPNIMSIKGSNMSIEKAIKLGEMLSRGGKSLADEDPAFEKKLKTR